MPLPSHRGRSGPIQSRSCLRRGAAACNRGMGTKRRGGKTQKGRSVLLRPSGRPPTPHAADAHLSSGAHCDVARESPMPLGSVRDGSVRHCKMVDRSAARHVHRGLATGSAAVGSGLDGAGRSRRPVQSFTFSC